MIGDPVYVWVVALMFTWSGHPTMGWPVAASHGGPPPFSTQADCEAVLPSWNAKAASEMGEFTHL
jgi:hypothetical protein